LAVVTAHALVQRLPAAQRDLHLGYELAVLDGVDAVTTS
jgi:hypothetical protein